jgi:hypothetical protein
LSSRDALGSESYTHWEIFDERIAMEPTPRACLTNFRKAGIESANPH